MSMLKMTQCTIAVLAIAGPSRDARSRGTSYELGIRTLVNTSSPLSRQRTELQYTKDTEKLMYSAIMAIIDM